MITLFLWIIYNIKCNNIFHFNCTLKCLINYKKCIVKQKWNILTVIHFFYWVIRKPWSYNVYGRNLSIWHIWGISWHIWGSVVWPQSTQTHWWPSWSPGRPRLQRQASSMTNWLPWRLRWCHRAEIPRVLLGVVQWNYSLFEYYLNFFFYHHLYEHWDLMWCTQEINYYYYYYWPSCVLTLSKIALSCHWRWANQGKCSDFEQLGMVAQS